jgi:hypothetical protein
METLPLPLQCYDDIEFSKGPIHQTDKLICNSWRKENRQGKRKRNVSVRQPLGQISVNVQISDNVPRISPVGPCDNSPSPLIPQWHFISSSFCMVRLQVGAIIDILDSNFTGNRSQSAVIVANPFVACYNNLTVWDSFSASLSDTENCLTICFYGYPQDSPLRLADILLNSNANGLRVLAHDRPPTSTKDWMMVMELDQFLVL